MYIPNHKKRKIKTHANYNKQKYKTNYNKQNYKTNYNKQVRSKIYIYIYQVNKFKGAFYLQNYNNKKVRYAKNEMNYNTQVAPQKIQNSPFPKNCKMRPSISKLAPLPILQLN